MKMVTKLSLIAMALMTISCQEKVSPELAEGSVSTTGGTTGGATIVPDEYYFSLTNTSSLLLNYKLHKTGDGNGAAACEVRSSSPLDNDTFRGAPATNDITCFMEAEELSLRAGGFSFKIEASPNTCEFISYSPYSYYNRMPGTSFGSYTNITCANTDTTAAHVLDASVAAGIDITTNTEDAASNPIQPTCNEYINTTAMMSSSSRTPFTPVTEAELCRFNYRDGALEQCDDGTINVTDLAVSYDAATAVLSYTATSRTIDCLGKAVNCISGPIKQHAELPYTRGSIITTATFDETLSMEQTYTPFVTTSQQSVLYANFRRDLANPLIDYPDSIHDFSGGIPYDPLYLGAWSSAAQGKVFNPNLMEKYSKNLQLDGTQHLSTTFSTTAAPTTIWETNSIESNMYTARPNAMDPYVGMTSSYQTSPFYTFYCLDTAWDIKARIRLVVREWDRIFPSTSNLEFLSDIYLGTSARQDLQDNVEDTSSSDPYNAFNDVNDWDDIIMMNRNDLGVPIIFKPEILTLTYPDGYFERAYFPNYAP